MIVPDTNLINRNRNVVKTFIIRSKISLTITQGYNPNDKTKQDHYNGLAYDVGSSTNKNNILLFHKYLKDNNDYIRSYGITRVLIGTVQPHLHISFNPEKANANGSIYWGYEIPDSKGNLYATKDLPNAYKILGNLYKDTSITRELPSTGISLQNKILMIIAAFPVLYALKILKKRD